MKKSVLIFLFFIASGSMSAVFFYGGSFDGNSEEAKTAVVAHSQLDTEVDTQSPRALLDYFMSGMGEVTLAEIENNISHQEYVINGMVVDKALFDQFVLYKKAMMGLESNDGLSMSVAALERLHNQILGLQQAFFTVEQQSLLFEKENQLRQLALLKLRLTQNSVNSDDFEYQWQQQLSDMPQYVQESFENAELLAKLTQMDQLTEQEKQLKREELVGAEASDRLAVLDQQRIVFQSKLDEYFAIRSSILSDLTLNEEEKHNAVSTLQDEFFSKAQLKRIAALERIKDSS